MEEVRSTTIFPIAFYCFFLGGYIAYLAVNIILRNNAVLSGDEFVRWFSGGVGIIFGGGLVVIGVGILKVNRLCWRILFFSLTICISCIASFLFVFSIFLLIGFKCLTPYFQNIQTTSAGWFSFLGIFLSEIIILFYLAHKEVVSAFGGMGPAISPF